MDTPMTDRQAWRRVATTVLVLVGVMFFLIVAANLID